MLWAAVPEGVVRVDLQQSKAVAPIQYGFHYEEIGMMGEGGLYAQLVRNPGLEEANMPRGLKVVDGKYANVPNPDGPRKDVYRMDPLIGWEVLPGAGGSANLARVDTHPLNGNNPHSLEVSIKEKGAAFRNTGFFGMHFKKGVQYRLAFHVRADNYTGGLNTVLANAQGEPVSSPFRLERIGRDWTKVEAVLTADREAVRGTLVFHADSPGVFQLDVVTMFPGDTWNHGKSVFRSDIMQNILDYKPDFIRFPGGCIVHGVNEETMYHWKETVGPLEQRPGAWSKWAPNYRTDGLGYHEFYELCEYLGADAMYVTPSGLVCTGWTFRDEKNRNIHPDTDVQIYIDDALDAIEYAIGPVTSKWGAQRAKNGHPDPFPLKYVEIGNEDFGPRYYENFEAIRSAIKRRYPNLRVIANSMIGKQTNDKRKYLEEFVNPQAIEIFDEHYYNGLSWVISNYHKFDEYSRSGPELFIGETGFGDRRTPYPLSILAEGVFQMALERNGDLKPLLADRPVMRHWDFTSGTSCFYYHTASKSFKTLNYYMMKQFRDNLIDTWFHSEWFPGEGSRELDESTVYSSAGRYDKDRSFSLKLINLTNTRRTIRIEIGDRPMTVSGSVTVLSAKPNQFNTPQDPDAVTPVLQQLKGFQFPCEYTLEPRSLTVFRLE